MKTLFALLMVSALPFLSGCSSPLPPTSANTKDLGIIEVVDRQTRHCVLSGNRDCQLTLTALQNGTILVEAVILRKDAQGNTSILARPRMETRSGQKVTIQTGDGTLELTPKRI